MESKGVWARKVNMREVTLELEVVVQIAENEFEYEIEILVGLAQTDLAAVLGRWRVGVRVRILE